MDGIIQGVLSQNKTASLKSKLPTSSAAQIKIREKRQLEDYYYYYRLAIHNPRPLIHACVILHRYGGQMGNDRLLRKLRSKEYFPYLFVAQNLGLIERHEQEFLTKWKRKKLLEPLIFLAEESKHEIKDAIRAHKEKYTVWTNEVIISNKLTDKGREIAKKAIETNFLQATKSRRYLA